MSLLKLDCFSFFPYQAKCGPSLSKQFLPILYKTSAQPAETFPNEKLFCIQDGQETEYYNHVEPFINKEAELS